jgi:regulator of protease activity HflC (stomatin/prohibitin superfamily)
MIVVSPGQAVVLTSLGRYIGTLGDEGWYWISPFARRRRISLRTVVSTSDIVRTHNAAAQPLELAATVMWQIDDTFRAAFCVEDPAGLVEKQALSALIRVAENLFPSPADEAHDTTTMRGNLEEVRANELRREIQSLSEFAGLRILDARLSHFRYLTAPALPRITPTYVPMLHAIASTTHATIREVVCEVHQGTLAGPVGDDDDSPPN